MSSGSARRTVDLHQLLFIHFLLLFLIVKGLIELEGLRDLLLLLLIGLGFTDVVTEPRDLLVSALDENVAEPQKR
jgi:hypothetical protein